MSKTEKEKCLEYIKGKHGIEDFIEWFMKQEEIYTFKEFKTALKSWIEAKSIVYNEGILPIQKKKKV